MLGDIEPYVFDICRVLKISTPTIAYTVDGVDPPTVRAIYETESDLLKINMLSDDIIESVFVIAHELRHKWQWRNKRSYFRSYKERKDCSLEEYNSQISELDANAFGVVALAHYFRVIPKFDGLPENIKRKIYKRAEEL